MTWSKGDTLLSLPFGIDKLASKLGAVAGAVAPAAELLKTALSTLSSLTIDELDLTQLAIKAAVGAVQSALAELVSGGSVRWLLVPMPRKPGTPARVLEALDYLGLKQIPGTKQSKLGNAGFLQIVLDSLNDQGDLQRPQYGDGDFVYGWVLLLGSSNLPALLPLIDRLRKLFGPLADNKTFARATFPIPQHLKAQVVLGPDGSLVPMLTWDREPPFVSIPGVGDASVTRIAIVRAMRPLLKVTNFGELFDENAQAGDRNAALDATVAAILITEPFALPSVTPRWTDDASQVEQGETYFYAVAFDYRLPDGSTTGFGKLSSVERVVLKQASGPVANSTPPDWEALPSPFALVPALDGYVRELSTYLAQWSAVTEGYSALLKNYVEWLTAEILIYESFLPRIAAAAQALSALAGGQYPVGVYARELSGLGGNKFLASELTKALTSDPDRPPFNLGTEYVMGIVVLTGGPSPAAFAPTRRALQLLLGSASSQANTITNAIAQIDATLNVVSKQFDQNLVPVILPLGPTPTALTPSTAPPIGSADTGNCKLLKDVPSTPVTFGHDLRAR